MLINSILKAELLNSTFSLMFHLIFKIYKIISVTFSWGLVKKSDKKLDTVRQPLAYRLNETSIDWTSCIYDLGALFDSELSFQQHMAYSDCKASGSLDQCMN